MSAPQITIDQFWTGPEGRRDVLYARELTAAIRHNAGITVERANKLLAMYSAATGDERPRGVTSGWRPAAVNSTTQGAAKRSNHMQGLAVDIADASGALDAWLGTAAGLAALGECELWAEAADATPTWCHVQIVPPRSGRRIFNP